MVAAGGIRERIRSAPEAYRGWGVGLTPGPRVERVEQERSFEVLLHTRAKNDRETAGMLHLPHPARSLGGPPHGQSVVERAPMDGATASRPPQSAVTLGE